MISDETKTEVQPQMNSNRHEFRGGAVDRRHSTARALPSRGGFVLPSAELFPGCGRWGRKAAPRVWRLLRAGFIGCALPTSGRVRVAESQRDSGTKPRVARPELPRESGLERVSTPTGLRRRLARSDATCVGLVRLTNSSQGRRDAPTLGLGTESLRVSQIPSPQFGAIHRFIIVHSPFGIQTF